MMVRFEFKPQDLWVGAFWKSRAYAGGRSTDVWLCLVPMVPLHVSWWRQPRRTWGGRP